MAWPGDPLSPRERQILELVAEGLQNKQIAARLGCATETVKTHMRNITLKLGASNRTHAVVLFARQNSDA